MRLLLVEDDPRLSSELRRALADHGFAVDTAAEGVEAEYLGNEEAYDAVILDLGLPGRPGLNVLAHWREQGNDVPVLILTGRDAWQEKVEGFKAGCDDYLAKPFHVEELIARLGALIRRRQGMSGGALRAGGLELDEESQSVRLADGSQIELTGTEFRLLRYFMLNPNRVLSKTRLSEHVYEYDADKDSNVIEVYVNRLRKKIGKQYFQTRRGQGYTFGGED